ncbi:hemicentin-2-like protein [Leptotrombidium deliense]|uniref:Hemicentin-2-like protein n=1 Tax=Leptotrombidium deliense TaxID=299467 RepID=A0A443SHK3_9ACAR|nr:hemicentin-2-like protein [Leptotrombidium deliense]
MLSYKTFTFIFLFVGRPTPSLQWSVNGKPVAGVDSARSVDIIENRYEIRHLNRSNLLDQLECKVSDSNGTVLRSKMLTIDMLLKPLEVRIVPFTEALSSGSKAELECLTYGSKPTAEISWWKGSKRMTDVMNVYSSDGNVTKSKVVFIPTTEDNGKHVSCRAFNTKMSNSVDAAKEDGIILNVHYVPQLTVNLGATIKRDSIKEGNNANPKVDEIVWTFDGKPLKSNSTQGVLVSNQSLVLRSVHKQHRGNYRCLATNKEGQTQSDPFMLRVKCEILYKYTHIHTTNSVTYSTHKKSRSLFISEKDIES